MFDEFFIVNNMVDSYVEMFLVVVDNLFFGSEQGNENSDENKLFYCNVLFIVVESFLLVVIFVIRYMFFGSVLNDLFILISFYCISFNLCCKIFYQFYYFF